MIPWLCSCEHCNESEGFIKDGQFLDQMSDSHLPRNDFSARYSAVCTTGIVHKVDTNQLYG